MILNFIQQIKHRTRGITKFITIMTMVKFFALQYTITFKLYIQIHM